MLQLGNPKLRSQAIPITHPESAELQLLIDQMIATMEASAGVGIAAPQVGHNEQLIIVASRPTLRYPQAPTMEPLAMLNPQLFPVGNRQEKDWEGCLSVPGIRGLVPRHHTVNVTYSDRWGQPQQHTFSGFIARIIQHEYDHLMGTVFLDRVGQTHELMTEQEYTQQILA